MITSFNVNKMSRSRALILATQSDSFWNDTPLFNTNQIPTEDLPTEWQEKYSNTNRQAMLEICNLDL